MKCPLLGGASKRLQAGGRHGAIAKRCGGAGDENPGSDFESDGEVDHVVAGGRDFRYQCAIDETVASTVLAIGLRRTGRSTQRATQ